jgi:hypothetical protein
MKEETMKNWLLNKLAYEKTYFPMFMGILTIYGILGCVMVHWAVESHPRAIKFITFLFLFGAAVVAYGSRKVHNLAYAKVNEINQGNKS